MRDCLMTKLMSWGLSQAVEFLVVKIFLLNSKVETMKSDTCIISFYQGDMLCLSPVGLASL